MLTGFFGNLARAGALALLLAAGSPARGSCGEPATSFPFLESFESVVPPGLPPGWTSSRNKVGGADDFVTATGTAHSGSNALLATNATIGQGVASPCFDFKGVIPGRLAFVTRRSSSFRASVVVEASLDSGKTYALQIGDTLQAGASSGYVQFSFALQSSLEGEHAVRFRWTVIPDSTGRAGTFRLDDISVTARPAQDLALAGLLLAPVPDEDERVSATVLVMNNGGTVRNPASVIFFFASVYDIVPGSRTWIADVPLCDSIAAGDSCTLEADLGHLGPGKGILTAILRDTLDQDPSNDTMRVPCPVSFRRGSVLINEIMYAPTAPEPEWLELMNIRDTPINLDSWSLSDAAVSVRHILTRSPCVLLPGEFAVLTRDTLGLREVHPVIAAHILQVPAFPSLNNGGDAVVVYDCTGKVVDSVVYDPSWGGSGGRSLERRDTEAPSMDPRNWGSCKKGSGSTPGGRNSIARRTVDAALDSLTCSPASVVAGDTMVLMAWVRITGRQPLCPGVVKFLRYGGADTTGGMIGLIGTAQVTELAAPLEVVRVDLPYRPSIAGRHRFFAVISPAGDEDSGNDTSSLVITVRAPPHGVVINEIMYDPDPGAPEWVELVNTTSDTIDLSDWRIGNHSTRYRMGSGLPTLAPSEYLLVTRDSASLQKEYDRVGSVVQPSSLPASCWNNTADAVVLTDAGGGVLDSVVYQSSWGGGDHTSLERRDIASPSCDRFAWGPSEDPHGATPGRRNSIAILAHDLRLASLTAVYDVAARAAVFQMAVQNAGKAAAAGCVVALYEDADGDSIIGAGDTIATCAAHQVIPPADSIAMVLRWEAARPGLHRIVGVVDTAGDERARNNTLSCSFAAPAAPGSMAINEIMYDPRAGESEYVELMNTSAGDVDIAGWRLGGQRGSGGSVDQVSLSHTACMVHAGELLIVAADSSVLKPFVTLNRRDQRLVRIGQWGGFGLANSGEEIVLRDGAGTLIDSVAYRPGWHRTGIGDPSGRSLERIRPTLSSNDPRNWSTCVDLRGGTPGERNSIFAGGVARATSLACAPNPFSPDGDGWEDFAVVHYAIPADVAVIDLKVFDVKGRLIRRLANNEASGAEGERIWDGCDDERRAVPMGIYILFLEACDQRGKLQWSSRVAVVVARRL